ncbi:MAG: imidazolonepropionase [Planctomycetes bacterium]|nr:imidazolonepropionase [Planctomycetota bacterium]MCB9901452.1 imidazolonepropionase [Planctomycetota bacterium]
MAKTTPRPADLLLLDAAEVVCVDDGRPGPAVGQAARDLGVIEGGGLAVRGGRIVGLGPSAEIQRTFKASKRVRLAGRTVLPGLVECHTHPVFARWRENEFAMRCEGADYEAILAAGGGIHASAAALRDAPRADLVTGTRRRLDDFLAHGVVAVEGKSGYGLTPETEIRSLDVLRAAGRNHPVHVERTFLGAHVVPKAYADKRAAYVRQVMHDMLPVVAKRKLARFCDVFVERGAFTVDEARTIFRAAKRLGLVPKVHADQFRDGGGALLAAEVGAVSAEHVDATGPAGRAALAKAGVIAVLLPTAAVFTGLAHRPDARALLDAGVAVALSTDLNPGTSPTANLALAAGLGTSLLGMTPAETITAITRNAACAIGQDERFGRLAVGRPATFTVLDAPSHVHLPYRLGQNLVESVWVRGERVFRAVRP